MRRRFKCDPKWITVRYPAKCAEPNCQTQIKQGERAFYYPADRAVYGSSCGHGEKAEREFAAHRIDEDAIEPNPRNKERRFLSCQSTK